MLEPQLRGLFKDIAEGAAPRADPELARRRGRVSLRRRRALLAGTSLVVTAAVAAAAVTMSQALPADRAAPAAGRAAPDRFNPLVPYLSFGWLPKDDKLVGGGTGLTEMFLSAAPGSDERSQIYDGWELSAYAAGRCKLAFEQLACAPVGPPGSAAGWALGITGRAPDVDGQRAFWAFDALTWQYARGGWAWLDLPARFRNPKLRGTAVLAAARRDALTIAGRVRYGTVTPPLLFPVQLTGLPSGWQLSSTTYAPDGAVLRASTYGLVPGSPDLNSPALDFDGGLIRNDLPTFSVTPVALRHNPCLLYPKWRGKSVRETIKGYHVIVTRKAGRIPSQDLCADNAGGLSVDVAIDGGHPVIGVTSLFKDHLRLLGPSPANWTRNPIG